MFAKSVLAIRRGLRILRSRHGFGGDVRIGLYTAVRDERDIGEWLRYHFAIGADAIIVYDNESDPLLEVDDPRVTIVRWAGTGQQMAMYEDCLARFGAKFDWLAFIDSDEYLMPVRHGNLRALLADYAAYDALVANWLIFGPGPHIHRPEGGVLRNYLYRLPYEHPRNLHVKSIFRPSTVDHFYNAHFPQYRQGHHAVNEQRWIVEGAHSNWSGDVIRVYHYWSRSREDWEWSKMRWPRPDTGLPVRAWEQFEEVSAEATEYDDSMAIFADSLGIYDEKKSWVTE